MARCCGDGGSGGCSCRLVAGDGIIVSGSGTPTDPFVLTAEVTSFASSFLVQDTSTLDLNLFGSGVPDDPFILSGSASIAMTELTDWDDPAGPALGDVPVWNGLAWEAAPPPTVAPGAVTVGAGLLGDGSIGAPLRVAVSDTTSTSTSGVAIYVDSAGKLRAVPGLTSVSWADITGKPTTFPSAWADVTGKPTTFAPQIGTTAATAWAGNRMPAWTEVTGKPVDFPSSWGNVSGKPNVAIQGNPLGNSGYAVMMVGAANQIGMYWNAGSNLPVVRIDTTDFPITTQALLSAVQTNLQTQIDGKANAWGGDVNVVRYAPGPTDGAYNRTVSGAGFFQVWMDNSLQFGRNVSARKYKTKIAPYPIAPADVLALTPVKYMLKSSPEAGEQYGLIADDAAKTLPEIVVFEDGKPETIRYDLLAVALLDVVKDLTARVEELEAR